MVNGTKREVFMGLLGVWGLQEKGKSYFRNFSLALLFLLLGI
jgi:hypothetical protein